MQQLQLDVKRQASTYAGIVKRGSGSKHKQHAEHHKNRQHTVRGGLGREKTVTVSLMPPLPPLLPLMNHPMLIIVFIKGIKSKLQALGKYGVRSSEKYNTSAVSNAVCSLTGMNADHLIFKRKYKTNPTKN